MCYFDRITVSLHILYTASQGTEGSQDRLILYDADLFYWALRASVALPGDVRAVRQRGYGLRILI